jgi:hypothetical protein
MRDFSRELTLEQHIKLDQVAIQKPGVVVVGWYSKAEKRGPIIMFPDLVRKYVNYNGRVNLCI